MVVEIVSGIRPAIRFELRYKISIFGRFNKQGGIVPVITFVGENDEFKVPIEGSSCLRHVLAVLMPIRYNALNPVASHIDDDNEPSKQFSDESNTSRLGCNANKSEGIVDVN